MEHQDMMVVKESFVVSVYSFARQIHCKNNVLGTAIFFILSVGSSVVYAYLLTLFDMLNEVKSMRFDKQNQISFIS